MNPPMSLALLVERLQWPVPRVRWETARQLADLVEAGDRQACDALLAWSASQRLEADGLILPSLVQARTLNDQFSFEEVSKAIAAPSLLSDALLAASYPDDAKRLFTFRLEYTKEGFNAPPESLFEQGVTTVVPPIFRHALDAEERRTGIPFLSQWRGEWSALQRAREEAYSLAPDYFFAGDRGRSGSFDLRQRAVFVSAFLRTLNWAHLECGMPRSYAIGMAELALPFNRGLFDFKGSERPAWSQGFLGRFEELGPAAFARAAWRDAAATLEAGFEPIALDMIDHNERLAVRVQVQRVLAGEEPGDVEARQLAHPAWVSTQGPHWSLEGTLPSPQRRRQTPGVRPLCVAADPTVFGRAHIDLLGRLLLADPLLATGPAALRCEADRLTLTDQVGLLSTLQLWYADWVPTHPPELALIGSLTACRRAALRAFRADCDVRTPRLARLQIARREQSYQPFDVTTHTFRL